MYLFADGMILYVENHKESTKKLLELTKKLSKFAGYKLNVQKWGVIIRTSNEQSHIPAMTNLKIKSRKQLHFKIALKNKILKSKFNHGWFYMLLFHESQHITKDPWVSEKNYFFPKSQRSNVISPDGCLHMQWGSELQNLEPETRHFLNNQQVLQHAAKKLTALPPGRVSSYLVATLDLLCCLWNIKTHKKGRWSNLFYEASIVTSDIILF